MYGDGMKEDGMSKLTWGSHCVMPLCWTRQLGVLVKGLTGVSPGQATTLEIIVDCSIGAFTGRSLFLS